MMHDSAWQKSSLAQIRGEVHLLVKAVRDLGDQQQKTQTEVAFIKGFLLQGPTPLQFVVSMFLSLLAGALTTLFAVLSLQP